MDRIPVVTKNLLAINIIMFLATLVFEQKGMDLNSIFGLHLVMAEDFLPFQLVTYMFMHGDLMHLFFNMFALWMFGRTLEYELGSQRFLVYYLACGIGAALVQYGVAWLMGELPLFLVGASGAVMGLLLAFGVMHPNATIMLLIPPIPMKAKWFVIIYAVIELFLGWRGVGQVAHFAHVGGMLWGWALLYYWKKRGEIYY